MSSNHRENRRKSIKHLVWEAIALYRMYGRKKSPLIFSSRHRLALLTRGLTSQISAELCEQKKKALRSVKDRKKNKKAETLRLRRIIRCTMFKKQCCRRNTSPKPLGNHSGPPSVLLYLFPPVHICRFCFLSHILRYTDIPNYC